jgi:hypothetical protein
MGARRLRLQKLQSGRKSSETDRSSSKSTGSKIKVAEVSLSYHAAGRRVLKMFASLDAAVADGKAKSTTLANGELDAIHVP